MRAADMANDFLHDPPYLGEDLFSTDAVPVMHAFNAATKCGHIWPCLAEYPFHPMHTFAQGHTQFTPIQLGMQAIITSAFYLTATKEMQV